MENSEKSMADYLEKDGNLGFFLAVYNRFSTIGDSSYLEICGGLNEGVYQWTDHNIASVVDCKNSKYHGWSIHFCSGSIRRVYIPNWVMEIKPINWRHAKALFNKYLLEDDKFNMSKEANQYLYC